MNAPHAWPEYTCNGRVFYSYQEALMYWTQHGGTLMEKLDAYTAAYVLKYPKERTATQ